MEFYSFSGGDVFLFVFWIGVFAAGLMAIRWAMRGD